MKALIRSEDSTQMESGRELLFEPLPTDVRRHVVWQPNVWFTNEAISTYRRSAGLVSNELHSPIMSVGNGAPALVGRFVEQATKGFV